MTPRAPALPPEERRATILAAARPLILELGGQVTTKQVADAAGIAEGTLFRVFTTKQELMCAVIEDVVDPSGVVAALEELRPSTLDEAVRGVFEVLRDHVRTTTMFFAALHASTRETDGPPRHQPPPHEAHRERIDRVTTAITGLLTPFAAQLTVPAERAASLVHTVALATLHPFLAAHHFDDLDEVTALMLHGFVRPDRQEN
ncbi:TetR/AcrR family transcriptional regulator [Aestuariimicrobium soli]|uniref:TetR/AcrR family transcriptional regulator n=1 Tax=Aestuariimicrobium soli TaxID=2035834 RepID=UPI003EC09831